MWTVDRLACHRGADSKFHRCVLESFTVVIIEISQNRSFMSLKIRRLLSRTHIVDHISLRVVAGPVEDGQERLQVLGGVVLCVEQQHRDQLGGSDPRGNQPVGYVVGDGRH